MGHGNDIAALVVHSTSAVSATEDAAQKVTQPVTQQFAAIVLASGRWTTEHEHTRHTRDSRDMIAWVAVCYAITARVELLSPDCALLDIGRCTPAEAAAVVRQALDALHAQGYAASGGVGPSLILAQLAALHRPPTTTSNGSRSNAGERLFTLGTAAASAHFLRQVPLTRLAQLAGRSRPAAATRERLAAYGLQTLGQAAALGELRLRRQFGAVAGAQLAALAAGRDLLPLQPTPPPAQQHLRLRLLEAASSQQLLSALLPAFAARVAALLQQEGRQARTFRLRLRLTSGAVYTGAHTLPEPTDEASVLTQVLVRVAQSLLPEDAAASRYAEVKATPSIDDLRVTLADFSSRTSAQTTLWPTRTSRARAAQRAAQTLATTLAQRHGRQLLLRPRCVQPDAIFPEEGYGWQPIAPDALADPPRPPESHRNTSQHPASSDADGDAWDGMLPRLHWW